MKSMLPLIVRVFVPEGQPIIAQRFIAGFGSQRLSPVGTAECPGLNLPAVPTGLRVDAIFPPINRWAIFKRPSGTFRLKQLRLS